MASTTTIAPHLPGLRFEPLTSPLLLAIIAVVVTGLVILFYRRYRTVVSPRYWVALVALKATAFAAIALMLMNPVLIRRAPDQENYTVMYLIDASGSMQTTDCGAERRIDFVKNRILSPESAFSRRFITPSENARFYLFAGTDIRRFEPGGNFNTLPGETDIDTALIDTLNSPVDNKTIGAVVLVSDGLDNVGASLMEAAIDFKKADIPVHCIGVGNPHPKNDIGIAWLDVPESGVKNEPLPMTARVTRNFSSETTAQVTLYEDGRILSEKTVVFDEGRLESELTFDHVAFTTGFKTYKITVAAADGEENHLNNTDFAGVEVNDPDVFKCLFFSANVDWEYKFLKIFAEKEEKLDIDAAVRLGETPWFVRGIGDEKTSLNRFPDCTVLNDYDCIVLHVNAQYLMNDEDFACLVNFVENKGGGVVFTGTADTFQTAFQDILPVAGLPRDTVRTSAGTIAFQSSQIMGADDITEIERLSNKLFVPDGTEVYPIEEKDLKPGALAVIHMAETSWVILAAQHYGTGKVALLNLPDTWKWVMQGDDDGHYHGLFWGRLISWMASASKSRLTIKPYARKLLLGSEQEFSVDVLDEQYNPDNGAAIACTVVGPEGEEPPMHLIPDPRVDGRYLGKFIPRFKGGYHFYFKVTPSEGDSIRADNEYLVLDMSPESEPRPMAEGPLQSLARQTGGEYWRYQDIDSVDEFALTKAVSYIEEKEHWIETWWFLACILIAVLPDWILRRRIGLR